MVRYSDPRWRRLRSKFLIDHPLCVMHLAQGKIVPAEVVDHIRPHKGDVELFYDVDNLQSLCKRCHDSVKKRLEVSGVEVGCNQKGMPIAEDHHWNKGRVG